MKKVLLFLACLCTMQLSAMDRDDDSNSAIISKITEPSPAERIEYCAVKQNINEKKFTAIITEYPNLHKIDVSDHAMTRIPAQQLRAHNLIFITLSSGKLSESTTLTQLLTICPLLTECTLDHNELTTLDEFKIPRHGLKKLNCSHNKLTNVDVTQLCKQLPNILNLNFSDNPLTHCNTKNMDRSEKQPSFVLNLKNTQLSDAVKKEIIKNGTRGISERYTFVLTFTGTALGAMTFLIPLVTMSPAGENYHGHTQFSSEQLGIIFGTMFINGLITGPLVANIGSLLCTNPKDREIVLFTPIFDPKPNYSEAEITTWFQRCIRHMPYWGNLCKKDDKTAHFDKV